jgi:hypothetical protein
VVLQFADLLYFDYPTLASFRFDDIQVRMLSASDARTGGAYPASFPGGGRHDTIHCLRQSQGKSTPADALRTGEEIGMSDFPLDNVRLQQIYCPGVT